MGRHTATAALILALFGCESALASKPSEEGWEHFGIDLLPSEHRAADDSWNVMVCTWSDSDSLHGTTAIVRLIPDSNTEGTTGDLTKTVPLGPTGAGNKNWPVRLVTKGDGPRRIAATIRIGHPGGPAIDEQEVVLDVVLRGGLVQVERKESVRATRLEHGQRFRYGGKYLVAIDSSEKERPRIDTRPLLKRGYVATCPRCVSDSQKVDLVVTVGRTGRITWIRPRTPWEPQIDPEVLAAATQAAKKWRFTPARASGKPVADWASITMLVLRQRDVGNPG